ncbi:phosphorylase [Geothrix sp. 21YS21S-4]|uniref:phosphorylase family protein n=1 Tax=Geothrix sp. 21YS21S-4 TaxID=3068889 RepID=UPI0027BB1944|nr:phosphorylase [Geothrix sp. 21YS21S-4]
MRLLLSAFAPELGPLAGNPPPGWETATVGVGAVTAAAATARLLVERRPEAVLFLGTCGRYDARLALFDCLWASEAVATSLEEVQGGAYRPGLERVRWESTLPGPLAAHSVAVPPAITKTAEGAARLASVAPAEHLELTGVFAACHGAGVPCGGALVVVNDVGPDAQAQWKANHAEGSRRLVEALRESGFFGRG